MFILTSIYIFPMQGFHPALKLTCVQRHAVSVAVTGGLSVQWWAAFVSNISKSRHMCASDQIRTWWWTLRYEIAFTEMVHRQFPHVIMLRWLWVYQNDVQWQCEIAVSNWGISTASWPFLGYCVFRRHAYTGTSMLKYRYIQSRYEVPVSPS